MPLNTKTYTKKTLKTKIFTKPKVKIENKTKTAQETPNDVKNQKPLKDPKNQKLHFTMTVKQETTLKKQTKSETKN